MKKTLLFSLASLTCGLSAIAQVVVDQSGNKSIPKASPESFLDFSQAILNQVQAPTIPMTQSKVPAGAKSMVSQIVSIPLGMEPNAFGTIGNRHYLWADPTINTVTLTHRVKIGAISGYLAYDVSKSGGRTWPGTNVGPIYTPDGNPGTTFCVARYPEGVIYNPTGNTIADSAYIAYFAAALDNSNPNGTANWGGHVYGVSKMTTSTTPTRHDDKSTATVKQFIPDDFFLSKTGTFYNIDHMAPGTAAYDMIDTLLLSTGTFNPVTRDVAYTVTKLQQHASLDNHSPAKHNFNQAKIVMADDGMNGYITAIEHNDFTFNPDSAYYMVVRKTTDGGATWGPQIKLDVNAADYFLNNDGVSRYTVAFDHSSVVDANGNLHMVMDIGVRPTGSPNGFYFGYTSGKVGIFDIFTTDGGATWRINLLRKPENWVGAYGVTGNTTNPGINEYNRPQASRTWNGNQLFFTWFETDSTAFSGAGNTHPNMWSVGYDILTKKWTAVKNFTTGSAAADVVNQGMVAYYVFTHSAGVYTIPCAYTTFPPAGDITLTGSPLQLNYIDSAQFKTADFTLGDPSVPLVTGVKEYKNNNVSVSQNYPNPFSNLTTIDIGLKNSSDVTVEVVNTLGQTVLVQQHKSLSAGSHSITLDATSLNAGIYFYSIRTADSSVTRKMTVK